jgi:protein TonB
VSLGGAIVAKADRLDTVPGRLAFRAVRPGGIEVRGMRMAKVTPTPSTFHPELLRADDPGIARPEVTRRAYPKYPASVRNQRISGVVLVEMVVEADGRLGDLQVVETAHPDLVAPALECIRKWRFKPATKDGASIAVTATMEIAFALADR